MMHERAVTVAKILVDQISQLQEGLRPARSTQTVDRHAGGQRGRLPEVVRGGEILEETTAEPVTVPVREKLEASVLCSQTFDGRGEARSQCIHGGQSARLE